MKRVIRKRERNLENTEIADRDVYDKDRSGGLKQSQRIIGTTRQGGVDFTRVDEEGEDIRLE